MATFGRQADERDLRPKTFGVRKPEQDEPCGFLSYRRSGRIDRQQAGLQTAIPANPTRPLSPSPNPMTHEGLPAMASSYFDEGELIPGTKLRIERTLGMGGQGEVHVVVNEVSKQRQVIKLLHPELVRSEAAMGRFEKEVQVMAMLDHRPIVKLLHTDVTAAVGGRPALPYLLMEHLEGHTLGAVLASPLASMRRSVGVGLFAQYADALAYAASKFGLVHRDIKPANLFLALDRRGVSTAKVLDFGISQLCEALTSITSDDFLGTEAYAAPEQYTGRTSPKTDVYQLGMVMWEGFAGNHPFHDRTTRQSIMYAQLELVPPPLSSTIPKCPRALSLIVEGMLDKNPRRRPTMEAVLQMLRELAKDPELRKDDSRMDRVTPGDVSSIGVHAAPSPHRSRDTPTAEPSARQEGAVDPAPAHAAAHAGSASLSGSPSGPSAVALAETTGHPSPEPGPPRRWTAHVVDFLESTVAAVLVGLSLLGAISWVAWLTFTDRRWPPKLASTQDAPVLSPSPSSVPPPSASLGATDPAGRGHGPP